MDHFSGAAPVIDATAGLNRGLRRHLTPSELRVAASGAPTGKPLIR